MQGRKSARTMFLLLVSLSALCASSSAARTLLAQKQVQPSDTLTSSLDYIQKAMTANRTNVSQVTCDNPSYTEIDLRPTRYMWMSEAGYCGESATQIVVLKKGIWIGQRAARDIAVNKTAQKSLFGFGHFATDWPHPDTWFEPYNSSGGMLHLITSLGLEAQQWGDDNQTRTLFPGRKTGIATPSVFEYLYWVKSNIIAGRPVIVGTQLRVSERAVDYDHIQPFFGIKYCREDALDMSDVFTWTGDLADVGVQPVNDSHLYANHMECIYDLDYEDKKETFCFAKDHKNYGIAVGDFKAPEGLYKPTNLSIDGWDDYYTEPYQEPGEEDVEDRYTEASFNVTVSNLIPGESCTIYKFSGLMPNRQLPQSAEAMDALCEQPPQGRECFSGAFVATAPEMQFNHPSNGTDKLPMEQSKAGFVFYSITYYLTICQPGEDKTPQYVRGTGDRVVVRG